MTNQHHYFRHIFPVLLIALFTTSLLSRACRVFAQSQRSIVSMDPRFANAERTRSAEIHFTRSSRGILAGAPRTIEPLVRYTRDTNTGSIRLIIRDPKVITLFAKDTLFTYFSDRRFLVVDPLNDSEFAPRIGPTLWALSFGIPLGIAEALCDSTAKASVRPVVIDDDSCLEVTFATNIYEHSNYFFLDSSRTHCTISFTNPAHSSFEYIDWTPVDSFCTICRGISGYYSDHFDHRIEAEIDSTLQALRADTSIRQVTPNQVRTLLADDTSAYVHVGDLFPPLELVTEDSVAATPFEDSHAGVTIVELYHNSCLPCMQSLRGISALRDSLRQLGGVVIGINCDNDDRANHALNRRIDARMGRRFSTYYGGRSQFRKYFHSSFPTFMVLDKDRRIFSTFSGYLVGFADAHLMQLAKAVLKRDAAR